MIHYDSTQQELQKYLNRTEETFNKLLSTYEGQASIKSSLDLGFPHDVIRIAGGFATGAYVEWNSSQPIIPVDTCVNVCSCSIFELDNDIIDIFNDATFTSINSKLQNGIYVSNFHRGNHFISYINSIITGKKYLLLHSSASEFKSNFNGLYPIKDNWFFDKIKIFTNGNSYIRYIKGKDAELFFKLAQNLIRFNENRHEFIANLFLKKVANVNNVVHHHHYFMPNENSVVMGNHIVASGQTVPILTIPGANIYMVKFLRATDALLYVDNNNFLAPHGWGKRHKQTPKINLNVNSSIFKLDDYEYNIEFGESLRSHPSLELRDFKTSDLNRKEGFLSYLNQIYEYELVDELSQIASYNKDGVVIW